MLRPVVLSGGIGSRLWPLSRGTHPKQFLNLVDPNKTMLQATLMRIQGLDDKSDPIVVCNEEHRFLVGEQLRQIGYNEADIILEPQGRNTAPAIALAALRAAQTSYEDVLIIMPADHLIVDESAFCKALDMAVAVAKHGQLVTLGVVPTHPETGYGYIRKSQELTELAKCVFAVERFTEKPSAARAAELLDNGDYLWNSGMFVARVDTILNELRTYAPQVMVACERAMSGLHADLDFLRVNESEFLACPSISMDYAVMEQTNKSAVVPLNVGWSDIGSWSSIYDASEKDEQGNACIGDVVSIDTKDCLLRGESSLVAAVGLQNIIVMQTPDAVLVADRESSQKVGEIAARLSEQERSLVAHHRKVYRPWGWYDSIDLGERFQVKRIQVNPGARLSVQKHRHRAEHWVVVKGVAQVRLGDDVFRLQENESTYIPLGAIHALHNPSDIQPLEIIEVQSGEYLGEDDIIRFEDEYGRIES